MNRLITTVFLIAISISVLAQPKGMGKNDPDAKNILDGVSAKYKTFKGVQANFSLKIENASGKSLGVKTGILYIKGNKYRISVTGKEIYCDGNTISTFDKEENEVTFTKVDPTSNSLTPQKIFSDFYNKDFLYKLNGETTVAGKKIEELELTPIDKSKPYFKVLVYVNKAAQTISSYKVFEKTGERTTYSIASMNTTTPVNDSQFTFNAKKFPGAEVVDLR